MVEKYKIIQEFEKELQSRRRWAYLAGILHKAAAWLGKGTVAWATIVLMGGFASNLAIPDFITVTLLVIFIIVLLAVAPFTCKLVTKRSLSAGSLQPLQLVYQDGRLTLVNLIKCSVCPAQLVILSPICWVYASQLLKSRLIWGALFSWLVSFFKPHVDIVSAADLASLQACLSPCATNHSLTTASALQTCVQDCFSAESSTSTYTAITNLQICLFTFHSLVVATSTVVILNNIYVLCHVGWAWWLMPFVTTQTFPKTLSTTRYHDEVLSRILSIGLIDACEFDATQFLVRCVGEDLVVRKIAPLEVKRQNEDFIKYLFYLPQGVEMVLGMLASEDTLLQQTAANMPGFWSSEHEGMERDGMELLSKLGEKLGFPGKVAEGAANSFKSLAVAWSEEDRSPLLDVYVSRSEGRRQGTIAGESIHMQILAPGEVSHGALESMVGSGNSTLDAVSRSEGGLDEREGESISTPPESAGDQTTSVTRGAAAGRSVFTTGEGAGGNGGEARGRSGRGRGEASTGHVQARSGGSGNVDELKWNVVQKVVDLVANKRVPTLQVYVRALDAFFMSESVRESLTKEEKDQIKGKLLKIVSGRPNGGANHARRGRVTVAVDSSARARTRLLAFSALERLGLDPSVDGERMLQLLDDRLNQVQETCVIWYEEVDRYVKLCETYDHRPGQWLESEKWVIRRLDIP